MSMNEVGAWFVLKYLSRREDAGVYVVAAQLRKQGVPLPVALSLLARRAPL